MSEYYVHHRERLADVTMDIAAVGRGDMPADLIIKNGKLVNVNICAIQEGIDVAVKHGLIAFVGNCSHIRTDSDTKIVDASGRYIVPGMIDGHMHIESAMIDPRNFAAGVLPAGVTTICPDNHEITNVLGLRAVELFHKVMEGFPIKFLLAMPVCVPSVPGLEDAGAVITADDVTKAYREGWAQLQGEQMNHPGLIFGDPNVHAITAASLNAGVLLTGHYPTLDLEKGLTTFIACGMNACHELTTKEGALRRAELGMSPQMRYGTAELDLPECIKAYTENPGIDDRMFTIVTDDVSALTVARDGQLLRAVREAIKQGVPPIKAIQYVTINTAQLLEKARWIGSVSPGRAADILIVSDLPGMVIDQVFSDGVLVAEHGKLTVKFEPYAYPDWALHTMHIEPLSPSDFKISTDGKKKVNARVIEVIPESVITKEHILAFDTPNGEIEADVDRDIAKAFDFYRHEPREGVTGTRGIGLIQGIRFKKNCAYASTVAHDSHNLLVIGTSDAAMAAAANKLIEVGGGIAIAVDNKVTACVAFPLAGLMTLVSAEETANQIIALEDAIKETGCPYANFEMTMSFLALPVIPELHLSNRGLIALKGDNPPELVDLIVK